MAPHPAGTAERVKSGTGFFVSDNGLVATSAHVISGCREVSVWDQNGDRRRAQILGLDRRLDVAMLRTEGTPPTQWVTATGLPSQSGEKVVTLGYGVLASRPLKPVLVEGVVSGNGMDRSGNRILLVRASLQSGHSGGALMADDGFLLGIIVGLDDEHPELGVAIPTEDIEPFLSGHGIRLPRHGPRQDGREFLMAISVLVQCV